MRLTRGGVAGKEEGSKRWLWCDVLIMTQCHSPTPNLNFFLPAAPSRWTRLVGNEMCSELRDIK